MTQINKKRPRQVTVFSCPYLTFRRSSAEHSWRLAVQLVNIATLFASYLKSYNALKGFEVNFITRKRSKWSLRPEHSPAFIPSMPFFNLMCTQACFTPTGRLSARAIYHSYQVNIQIRRAVQSFAQTEKYLVVLWPGTTHNLTARGRQRELLQGQNPALLGHGTAEGDRTAQGPWKSLQYLLSGMGFLCMGQQTPVCKAKILDTLIKKWNDLNGFSSTAFLVRGVQCPLLHCQALMWWGHRAHFKSKINYLAWAAGEGHFFHCYLAKEEQSSAEWDQNQPSNTYSVLQYRWLASLSHLLFEADKWQHWNFRWASHCRWSPYWGALTHALTLKLSVFHSSLSCLFSPQKTLEARQGFSIQCRTTNSRNFLLNIPFSLPTEANADYHFHRYLLLSNSWKEYIMIFSIYPSTAWLTRWKTTIVLDSRCWKNTYCIEFIPHLKLLLQTINPNVSLIIILY